MVLGAITQDPYHLNLFQMPVMVLGTTEPPPANTQFVGAYGQYLVSGQDAGLVLSASSSSSAEPVSNNVKNRMMLGVG
jgi:hypothetical protein